MRIISWNVNGLRAILKKDFYQSIDKMQPDILCLQEIKVDVDNIPKIELPGYHFIFNSAIRKGYAGTAVFTKCQPSSINKETSIDKLTRESEGRVIISEYDNFILVNVYTPNSGDALARLHFRYTIWDVEMLKMIKRLREIKPVILCGDMNVAHEDIDLENPQTNHFSAGFTDEERIGMNNYLENFGIDTFRKFYPGKEKCYSWWSYRMLSRERNVGWRIDYIIADVTLARNIKNAFIMSNILGSDHAPVGIDIVF